MLHPIHQGIISGRSASLHNIDPQFFAYAGLRINFVASSGFAGGGVLFELPLPAGSAVGDLCIAAGQIQTGALVEPSGWTTLFSNTTVRDTRGIAKILVSGDISSGIINFAGDLSASDGVAITFRPTRPLVSFTPADWTSEGTSGDPAAQTANASGGVPPLIVVGVAACAAATVVFNASTIPAFDATATNSETDILMGYKIYYASPQDHVIDMDDLVSNNVLGTGYITFT